ncbi:hypothetical protein [Gordonia soli]|uniref:Uncharacterized protein n=1 Tax=Gordonia soli NBRC 108243 TaxID=1223545 RepID=M0QIC0_9ACTN|nr:hypothetical protein GS4_14_00280 [Gordonia soli NBRC 108243]
MVPSVILATAALGWLGPQTAQFVAEIVMICRIASTTYVIRRFRREPLTAGTLLAAVGLAVLGSVIVALKVVLTH